mgnify:CR=1 FL=1
MMYHLVRDVLSNGGTPEEVGKAISWRKKRLFLVFEGHLNSQDVCSEIMKTDGGGQLPRVKRYFTNEEQIFHVEDIGTHGGSIRVYIKKNKEVLPWKDFNKNMAVSVEYNLNY